jgi:hypothetical protein
MKIIAHVFLFFFTVSLSTPIIVSLIEKDSTISFVIDSSEEKENKEKTEELKEMKADLSLAFNYNLLSPICLPSTKIVFENTSKHDEVLEEIFSPPPELI